MWEISRPFFVFDYFLTFFGLNFLPLLVMALMMKSIEGDCGFFVKFIFYSSVIAFIFGTFWNLVAEVSEMKARGLK